jgi:hypothetical protein
MVQIPLRTSSKRALETLEESKLEEQRNDINKELSYSRKKLRPQASFTSLYASHHRHYSEIASANMFFANSYWTQAADVARQLQNRNEIRRKISLRDYMVEGSGEEGDWLKTAKAGLLFAEMKAAEVDEKICERQAKRLENSAAKPAGNLRRSFIELFTTSTLGLGITFTGRGKRNADLQDQFRKSMIQEYNAHDPNPKRDFLWCPILKRWITQEGATAAHLFAYMHGQNVMDSIFGPMDPPELFSPLNGIIMSSTIEAKFDQGFFVIVPRFPENPSVSEVSAWNSSHPKEYKVRIIDMKHEVIDHVILPDSPQTWRDLDGTNVEFRSDFRPRARYLYFNYCVQILKVSWKPGKHREMGEAIQMELGRHFWGTPGRYLPREMLMAFVEEMGHEYEQLLEGAMEDGAADADADADSDLLLAAASDEVKASAQGVQIDSDEDDESDYEDAENSDEDY